MGASQRAQKDGLSRWGFFARPIGQGRLLWTSRGAQRRWEMMGSFQAQYFKFLTMDPNTIFQFFVDSDRLYLVKVGSALNQLPQVVHLAMGPVGLADLAADGLPSAAEVQKLMRADRANYELPYSELTSCVLKPKQWYGGDGSVTVESTKRGKLFYRFLDQVQAGRARTALKAALPDRLKVEWR
jgi:hypothetical protein